jgi:hypothetical protein
MPDRRRIIKDERKLTCSKLNNIRWQSGDIRFSMKSKGNMTMLLYDLETNTQTILRESFIQNLKSKILERGQKYIDGLSTAPFNVGEYINKYLRTDNLITKQLNKIKDENVRDAIISKFEIYINNVHSNLFKDIDKASLERLHVNFKNASTQLYSKEFNLSIFDIWKNRDMLSTYDKAMMRMDSLLLDLYSLARSYKTMSTYMNEEKESNHKYPIINICYFGNAHTSNINDFLTTIAGKKDYDGGYVGPSITNLDKQSGNIRCLYINKTEFTTDLDKQITRIKRIRKEHEETIKI